MRYVMSVDQFNQLKEEATKHEQIKQLTQNDTNSGTIDTKDVQIEYNYDGVALNFQVTKKYSLASHMASDTVIAKHIQSTIAEVLQGANQTAIANANATEGDQTNKPALVVKTPIKLNDGTENKENN